MKDALCSGSKDSAQSVRKQSNNHNRFCCSVVEDRWMKGQRWVGIGSCAAPLADFGPAARGSHGLPEPRSAALPSRPAQEITDDMACMSDIRLTAELQTLNLWSVPNVRHCVESRRPLQWFPCKSSARREKCSKRPGPSAGRAGGSGWCRRWVLSTRGTCP